MKSDDDKWKVDSGNQMQNGSEYQKWKVKSDKFTMESGKLKRKVGSEKRKK